MRPTSLTVAATISTLLLAAAVGAATDGTGAAHDSSAGTPRAWTTVPLDATASAARRLLAEQPIAPEDLARGCCVFSAPTTCNYGTRGYCRDLARKNGKRLEFFEGIPCRNVQQCAAGGQSTLR